MLWLRLSHLPMFPRQRAKCLKWAGVHITGKPLIYNGVVIDSVRPDLVYIGNRSVLTTGVVVLTHFLDPDKSTESKYCFKVGSVKIGNNVFIGARTIICNSISIGDGAVVGAGSVVTKDIPENEIWAGNPAKFIRKRR